eukprot:CAMPEP_0115509364 /NCGR_PEP_ID=MMETSP0271-20121206/72813_1 /TAXON_ID=71861 /ORGANISM="Scrippsiella trochoidea, Strain CCMP3099" /LENGTH=38 /DNA_ID= /DNA_START= /DNA_END= /DNA_ORIENTATION=
MPVAMDRRQHEVAVAEQLLVHELERAPILQDGRQGHLL